MNREYGIYIRRLCYVLVILFVAYGVYSLHSWSLDTQPVVEFTHGEISATEARPNDLLIVYLNVRKSQDCPGISQRRLTGECGEHILSESMTYRPGGFVGRVMLTFQVPEAAIPGPCAFQVHTWFVCNPFDLWHGRHYESKPIPFKVLRYDE